MLDVIITTSSIRLLSLVVHPPLLSDHSLIVAQLPVAHVTFDGSTTTHVSSVIAASEMDVDAFANDLRASRRWSAIRRSTTVTNISTATIERYVNWSTNTFRSIRRQSSWSDESTDTSHLGIMMRAVSPNERPDVSKNIRLPSYTQL